MPVKIRKLEKGLKAKGFTRKNSNHIVMTYVTESGLRTSVITHFSHRASGKEVSDHEMGKMAKQCELSIKQFMELVDCTLSRKEYEKLLLHANRIVPSDTEIGYRGD